MKRRPPGRLFLSGATEPHSTAVSPASMNLQESDMKQSYLPPVVLVLLLALSVLCLATSPVFAKSSQRPGERPTDLIAADLEIPEAVFVACFEAVEPAQDHKPSGARQQRNKAVLLPCLQAANPEISNARLDEVMDRYRPEGPIRR